MATDARAAPEALFLSNPEVIVDAAGPFRDYGTNPYVIPRLCLSTMGLLPAAAAKAARVGIRRRLEHHNGRAALVDSQLDLASFG